MPRIPVAVGTVVGERYRVERVLGAGTMGVVVAAQHLELDATVAIKFLNPEVGGEEACERFRREVRAAARLRSVHAARVLDVGELADGAPFMVMDLLHGCSLEEEITKRGVMPIHEAVDYVLQATEVLAEAHAAGIVHRDLKPSNLFLTTRADGSPLIKVIDFGVSKSMRESGVDVVGGLTRTGMVIGSPLYMAPEQLLATWSVDGRADIWALGVVLFELLTGHTPYATTSIAELYSMLLRDPPARPSQFRSELPAELEAIVMRCLEREPSARFQTMSELAEQLSRFAAECEEREAARSLSRGGGSSIAMDASAATDDARAVSAAEPKETGASWQRTQRPEAGRSSLRFALALLALTLLGSLAVHARLQRRTPRLEAATDAHVAAAVLDEPAMGTPPPHSAADRPAEVAARDALKGPPAPPLKALPRALSGAPRSRQSRELPAPSGATGVGYRLPDFGGRR